MREWRLARAAGAGGGCLELEWPVGACRADFGNFRAVVAGEALDPKPLVATLPHPDDRQCAALRPQRAERPCAGLAEVFPRWGRAPRAVVPDDATEAGRPVRGEVTEPGPFSRLRGHHRFESRCRDPRSGNERGSAGNAVGLPRRDPLAPVPSVASVAEPSAPLAEGCARPSASASRRDGRPGAEAPLEDLAAMRALPGVASDAARWVPARADKRGYVGVDGREYVAGPAWHGGAPPVGMRPDGVEIPADRGRGVAVPPRAYGEGPAVRDPPSPVPAIAARPRALGESTIRRDMPPGPVEAIDRMDAAGRRRTPRSTERASAASGSEAACEAALGVVEGGRAPDGATVDALARRIAAGSAAVAGAPASPRTTGSRGRRRMAAGDALARGAVEAGGARSLTTAVLGERSGLGTPRRVGYLAGHPEAERASREASRRAALPGRCALPAPKSLGGHDWPAVSRPEGMGRESPTSPEFPERREDLVPMGDVGCGKTHMAPALRSPACEAGPEARFFTASSLVMRLRRARDEGRLDRESEAVGRARLLVIDEPGFLPLDPDGARPLFQVFADACERQSAVITTNLESGRRGSVLGDDQMAAAVIDRVVHHGRLIRFRGESYRVRNALMREA